MYTFWIGSRKKLACLLVLSGALTACGARHQATHAFFVGKWKSSKLETPLVLFDNGEWEIKPDDGGVLQYGIWEYRDGNLIWSFKSGGQIIRDVNPVVSAKDREFRLQEGMQITVFNRLD
jgi:hypothetical protein